MRFRHLYLTNMKRCSKSLSTNFPKKIPLDQVQVDYEAAIKALNTLQSNAEYIRQRISNTLQMSHKEEVSVSVLQTQKYLSRADVSLEMLDTLPVIHVAGTKGKGSTCALCESILRHHGFRTGFYSSPHLLEVRERIRINGLPIPKQDFISQFWEIFNKLSARKSSATDMPQYFTFLTIMAFKMFLIEQVDVAIFEVGIGGEYDSTNILRKVPVVGITSLGLDHTNILGNTIEKIAWHKAGIIKPGSRVYTVPQTQSALEVLKERGIERNCSSFEIVEPLQNFSVMNNNFPSDIFNLNSNLAVALSQAWINLGNRPKNVIAQTNDILSIEAITLGLLNFTWHGRYQVIHNKLNTFYIDGAHTQDSIQVCADWFKSLTCNSASKRALIFNATGDRNSEELLGLLVDCKFDKVFFVPNKAISKAIPDMASTNSVEDQQLMRCHNHHKIWTSFETSTESVKVLPSIMGALDECPKNYNILITGSLHLVGAALSVLGPTSTRDT